MSKARQFEETSYLFGSNAVFIEEMYNRFVEDPMSVDEEWRAFFADLGDELSSVVSRNKGASWLPKKNNIVGIKTAEDSAPKKSTGAASKEDLSEACRDSIRALMLIYSYRISGHLLADFDPLGIDKPVMGKELDPMSYGFTEDDMDKEIHLGGVLGKDSLTLRELVAHLRKSYSSHVSAEFMHIEDPDQRIWFEKRFETGLYARKFSPEEKRKLFSDIAEIEGFEQFLHKKFPGAKRFSVEGGETSVIATEMVVAKAAECGVKEIIIGMPHRGRLNTLTKVMGKPYYAMLSEFQGNLAHPEEMEISGDVKYHLGTSSDRDFNGNVVHVSLNANPSHLEAVNPVVVGKVRGKQKIFGDEERKEAFGLLLHGDAAFAGQGVVAETLNLGDLEGYTTGGTVHVIVNNQIGFTTGPKNARSSRYPTEIAKYMQIPILHVNGDDPEAVAYASNLAVEYRQEFKKDVVIDVICYRKYGHNESDEPMFTQPTMYQNINKRKSVVSIYANRLAQEGVMTEEETRQVQKDFYGFLEKEYEAAEAYKPNKADWLEGAWKGLKSSKQSKKQIHTGVASTTLKKVGKALSENPKGHNTNKKIVRFLENRRKMIDSGKGIDWSLGEALAFGTLLTENHSVRLSGQDCGRGTFSHRHSVLVDQENENRFIPLNHIQPKQGMYEVIDSNLSEFAVLGFEYGYSLAQPNSLVLWEAQFGDFANGAQVIIDQFISSGEIKWLRMSGLVMLLPHGYEGQGPEHSSARLERFLQLCAEDNIQVANCTTPANYFHILRRQLCREFRKPLVVMTPKSLLRHKLAISELKDFETGTHFLPVITEEDKLSAATKIRRVVICSGKVYYDLLEERRNRNIQDVAILRLEQFYPFPAKELIEALKPYKNAEIVWCQEEPKNMGAWSFVHEFIEDEVLAKIKVGSTRPRYVGRPAAASPAAGYARVHKIEQTALVDEALK